MKHDHLQCHYDCLNVTHQCHSTWDDDPVQTQAVHHPPHHCGYTPIPSQKILTLDAYILSQKCEQSLGQAAESILQVPEAPRQSQTLGIVFFSWRWQ